MTEGLGTHLCSPLGASLWVLSTPLKRSTTPGVCECADDRDLMLAGSLTVRIFPNIFVAPRFMTEFMALGQLPVSAVEFESSGLQVVTA